MAFLAQIMGRELETVQLCIGHSLCIVAGGAFFYVHSFNIGRLHVAVGSVMMAFFAPEGFLMLFVGKSGGFCAGSSF
jgi:hypothetical protein